VRANLAESLPHFPSRQFTSWSSLPASTTRQRQTHHSSSTIAKQALSCRLTRLQTAEVTMAASTSTSTSPSLMDHLDRTTITSLLAVVALLAAAYALSLYALPSPSKGPSKRQVTKHARPLFIWHVFDCLIHAIFEGSYLYNVFFSFSPYSPATSHPVSLQNFLGSPHRLYGAKYADPSNWASSLWMVYAQADRRWEGVNLTVVSLELLTVLVGGPLAAYVSWLIARGDWRMNFWIVVLATAEIYGGESLLFRNSRAWLSRLRGWCLDEDIRC
jgi:hypothetical protein